MAPSAGRRVNRPCAAWRRTLSTPSRRRGRRRVPPGRRTWRRPPGGRRRPARRGEAPEVVGLAAPTSSTRRRKASPLSGTRRARRRTRSAPSASRRRTPARRRGRCRTGQCSALEVSRMSAEWGADRHGARKPVMGSVVPGKARPVWRTVRPKDVRSCRVSASMRYRTATNLVLKSSIGVDLPGWRAARRDRVWWPCPSGVQS